MQTPSPIARLPSPPRRRQDIIARRIRVRGGMGNVTNVRFQLRESESEMRPAMRRRVSQRTSTNQSVPLEEFLRYVIATNPPYSHRRTPFVEERSIPEAERWRQYGFVDPNSEGSPRDNDRYRRQRSLVGLMNDEEVGSQFVILFVDWARFEGLSVRDATGLPQCWRGYVFQLPIVPQQPAVRRTVSPSPLALAFWVAVRRGWGSWTPEASYLRVGNSLLLAIDETTGNITYD